MASDMDEHALSDEVPGASIRFRNTARPLYWWIASKLPLYLRRQYLHTLAVGRPANLSHPRGFNEKVHWRVLHDRRPMVAAACDKMKMKQMARERVGEDELKVPQTLWSGTNVDEAPGLATVPAAVLKPNHSSGKVIVDPARFTVAELRLRTNGWLRSMPAADLGEWGYRHAEPVLLLEELIGDGRSVPPDFKFFVFAGEVRLVQVNSDRFGKQPRATFYDRDWTKLPVRWRSTPSGDVDRPARLSTMVAIAERLGAEWDFIRIDLYAVGDEVWFGEFTPYPGGGVIRYTPASFDRDLGDLWTLPTREEVRARIV